MKKPRLTPLLILWLSCQLMAQEVSESKDKKFQAGLYWGVPNSIFTKRIGEFGESSEYDSYIKSGINLAIHSRFKINSLIGIKQEILVSGRGGSYRTENGVVSIGSGGASENFNYKNYRLRYIEIPILLDLDFTKRKVKESLHITASAGLSAGINVKSSLRYNGYSPTGTSFGPLDEVEEKYTVVDAPAGEKIITNYVFELSFEFPSRKNIIQFMRIRQTSSIGSVYSMNEFDGHNMKTKMHTWSLNYGFYFGKPR